MGLAIITYSLNGKTEKNMHNIDQMNNGFDSLEYLLYIAGLEKSQNIYKFCLQTDGRSKKKNHRF